MLRYVGIFFFLQRGYSGFFFVSFSLMCVFFVGSRLYQVLLLLFSPSLLLYVVSLSLRLEMHTLDSHVCLKLVLQFSFSLHCVIWECSGWELVFQWIYLYFRGYFCTTGCVGPFCGLYSLKVVGVKKKIAVTPTFKIISDLCMLLTVKYYPEVSREEAMRMCSSDLFPWSFIW